MSKALNLQDSLTKLFLELKTKNATARHTAAKKLLDFIASEGRELSGEAFNKLFNDLNKSIVELLSSSDSVDKLGAIEAIDKLLLLDMEDNSMKITLFANHLRNVLQLKDFTIVSRAAKVLGRLASIGTSVTTEVVLFHIERSLEWLASDRKDDLERRHASFFVLKELAVSCPTVFFASVSTVLHLLWVGLRDTSQQLREEAAETLHAVLALVAKREGGGKSSHYFTVYEQIEKGLKMNSSDCVHGSLLALGELCATENEVLKAHFHEMCEAVLKLKDKGDKLTRRTALTLLPKLAGFYPEEYVKGYLVPSMNHLAAMARRDSDRALAFVVISEMAKAVSVNIGPYLSALIPLLKDSLSSRRGKASPESLLCIASFSSSLGTAFEKYMPELLPALFSCSLSKETVRALGEIGAHIPSTLPDIQNRILNLIAYTFTGSGFATPGVDEDPATPAVTPSTSSSRKSANKTQPEDETGQLLLALETLAAFNLHGVAVLPFLKDSVLPFLYHDSLDVRLSAGKAVCTLLAREPVASLSSSKREVVDKLDHPTAPLVAEITGKLLQIAVTDPDRQVRVAILNMLSERFDSFLSHSDNLRCLFVALNDQYFEVRRVAVRMVGGLASHNPAYVIPTMRKLLIQLLSDMEFSGDTRIKEEAAQLLKELIQSANTLIKPYVESIFNAVASKLTDAHIRSTDVSTYVLSALGVLAQVGGDTMHKHLPVLMPHVLEAMADMRSDTRRLTAYVVLGQLVTFTGYAIQPFLDYPQLLLSIRHAIRSETKKQLRRAVIKVVGVLGAIDPYKHKTIQLQYSVRRNALPGDLEDLERDLTPKEEAQDTAVENMSISSKPDDYFPQVAITALIRILADTTLSAFHISVVTSVMHILNALGLKSVPYLPRIMPPFLAIMKDCEPRLRDLLFQKLGAITGIVKVHIRPYLPRVFALIHQFWSSKHQIHIITLLRELSAALRDEFKEYLPDLLPQILSTLSAPADEGALVPLLQTVEAFGPNIDDYSNLILPLIIRIVENQEFSQAIRVQALQALRGLCGTISMIDYSSLLVHPLSKLLDTRPELVTPAMATLTALVHQLGSGYAIHIRPVARVLSRRKIVYPEYNIAVQRILSGGDVGDPDWPAPPRQVFQDEAAPERPYTAKYQLNQSYVRKAWECNSCTTKEDWLEWIRRLSIDMLKESPSPALRACAGLSQVPALARQLFNAAFYSCWMELSATNQADLVVSMDMALSSSSITPEILQVLLNLCEFMERNEAVVDINLRKLGALADKCHAYAKALHYRELEFQSNPSSTVEALITINNQLQQPEAAQGILEHARQKLGMDLKESWYEKLHRWEDALALYERKQLEDPLSLTPTVGRMRCLKALGEWERLDQVSRQTWQSLNSKSAKEQVAPLAASAAWNLGKWEALETYVGSISRDSGDGAFFRAILSLYHKDYVSTRNHINRSRAILDTDLTALMCESYGRAYNTVVRGQQLSELEELIIYRNTASAEQRQTLRGLWETRLRGCQKHIDVWERVLAVHSLVIPRRENIPMWIKFASLCRAHKRERRSLKTLISLLPRPISDAEAENLHLPSDTPPLVSYAFFKHAWHTGSRTLAFTSLFNFTQSLANMPHLQAKCYLRLGLWARDLKESGGEGEEYLPGVDAVRYNPSGAASRRGSFESSVHTHTRTGGQGGPGAQGGGGGAGGLVTAMGTLKLAEPGKRGEKSAALPQPTATIRSLGDILDCFHMATQYDNSSYKAWHGWALMNHDVVMQMSAEKHSLEKMTPFIVSAVQGFIRSMDLGRESSADILQDTLRLLTLWFKYGSIPEVDATLANGFNHVPVDTWLAVLPQLIARIHSPIPSVRRSVIDLLTLVGKAHPQALMYPLMVAIKSHSKTRSTAAREVMENIRKHSPSLVDQTTLVSLELIRAAITWDEMWCEGLEDASNLFFQEKNINGMFAVLDPLHEMIEKGHETLRETNFIQTYARDLSDARTWGRRYHQSGNPNDLNSAWDLYYHVFRRINKNVGAMKSLELKYVAPRLLEANNLEVAIPGTYQPHRDIVRIASFNPHVKCMKSKQRPRQLTINGSDGKPYMYLLKGHEDLRQDERVMQLFGLINTLLSTDPSTSRHHLSIERYAVVPLSPNSGLISWLQHCDTLHELIKEFRDSRKLTLNIEHKLMLVLAPEFEHLTIMQKVEAFEHALCNTSGTDLFKIMWLKSPTSEVWLDRRTNYTRSLAVMSMVGYVLGLGDRHPSNIMIHQHTGKISHIDFGDCFEVAMQREKFPEKIPFRLTRMMVNAMEVSGIEGNFRITCENVMRVLRDHKDSVMAVLEAFLYDPLINWRLNHTKSPDMTTPQNAHDMSSFNGEIAPRIVNPSNVDEDEVVVTDVTEGPNERALQAIERVQAKLTGKDFARVTLDVPNHVDRLIRQATSHENLCQCYIGWCPFW